MNRRPTTGPGKGAETQESILHFFVRRGDVPCVWCVRARERSRLARNARDNCTPGSRSAAIMTTPRVQLLRVSLVQFAPTPPNASGDSAKTNLAKAHDFVRQAAQQGSHLVVFPEYFISGIIADLDTGAVHQHYTQLPHSEHAEHPTRGDDEDEPQHWLESFRQLAILCNIDICPGTIVERHGHAADSGSGEEGTAAPALKNVAHYITKEGEIVGRYEKRNLW